MKSRIQLTSTHQTAPLCPSNVPTLSPFSEYHIAGWASLATENNKSPSLLYLICVMERSWPCSIRGFYSTNKYTKAKHFVKPNKPTAAHYEELAIISHHVCFCGKTRPPNCWYEKQGSYRKRLLSSPRLTSRNKCTVSHQSEDQQKYRFLRF